MKPDPGSSLVSEVNLKWIKGLNVGNETMKTLQENMDIGMGKMMMMMMMIWTRPPSTENKAKIDK